MGITIAVTLMVLLGGIYFYKKYLSEKFTDSASTGFDGSGSGNGDGNNDLESKL